MTPSRRLLEIVNELDARALHGQALSADELRELVKKLTSIMGDVAQTEGELNGWKCEFEDLTRRIA